MAWRTLLVAWFLLLLWAGGWETVGYYRGSTCAVRVNYLVRAWQTGRRVVVVRFVLFVWMCGSGSGSEGIDATVRLFGRLVRGGEVTGDFV